MFSMTKARDEAFSEWYNVFQLNLTSKKRSKPDGNYICAVALLRLQGDRHRMDWMTCCKFSHITQKSDKRIFESRVLPSCQACLSQQYDIDPKSPHNRTVFMSIVLLRRPQELTISLSSDSHTFRISPKNKYVLRNKSGILSRFLRERPQSLTHALKGALHKVSGSNFPTSFSSNYRQLLSRAGCLIFDASIASQCQCFQLLSRRRKLFKSFMWSILMH